MKILPTNETIVDVKFNFNNSNSYVRKSIGESDEYVIEQRSKPYFTVTNPRSLQLSYLYGFPKIHENRQPHKTYGFLYSSPTYKQSKYLDGGLKNGTNFQSKHSIQNTLELINRLKILEQHGTLS